MLFNSIEFLVFFPCVIILYFIFPSKIRWLWLLIVSYFFYMQWNPKYAILILISTVITYLSGLLIGRTSNKKEKMIWLVLSLVSNLAILFFFKYYKFGVGSIEMFLRWINIESPEFPVFNYLLPVGISFYTFQALSYTIDVYRNKIKPEYHFGKYALFVTFFPQLVAGPIEQASKLLPQFHKKTTFDYDRIRDGLLLMSFGFFKKLVIADRLGVFVNTAYLNPLQYDGMTMIIATIFFHIQVYVDFSGYTDIGIGAAKVMGYNLTTNFKHPFFAISTPDFWRRWHVTLGAWFREYVYFPLGGNKNGVWRGHLNIMIVFLVSGLWHGAHWTFVIWGFCHGMLYVLSKETKFINRGILKFFRVGEGNFVVRLYHILLTFAFGSFLRIFFRDSFTESLNVLRSMKNISLSVLSDGSLFLMGLDNKEMYVALFSIALLIIVGIYKEKFDIFKDLAKQFILVRWLFYILLILTIIIFGKYDSTVEAFVYFQF